MNNLPTGTLPVKQIFRITLLRYICMEIASHTQKHPEEITLSDGLLKAFNQEIAIAKAEGVREFKKNVVEYALESLEHDCLSGPGLSEDMAAAIKRLHYWIVEKEISLLENSEVGIDTENLTRTTYPKLSHPEGIP